MEYGRGTRGYAALKLREQDYKTVTSHIMYCTDLRSTCIYSTYNIYTWYVKHAIKRRAAWRVGGSLSYLLWGELALGTRLVEKCDVGEFST